MDQFADTGRVVDRGSCNSNDDGSGESKWKGEIDSLVVGKKRPPSTFHPQTFNSTKKRSQENYRGSDDGQSCAQSRMYDTSHDIDSTYELEERLETMEEEENNQDTDNNDSDDHWKEFVDAVDAKSIPNLDAYMKAKAIRTETSIRFVNAMDACIQTLRDTTEGILSEVVEPICNRHSEHFNYEEESIVETMVSNHSRRKELLELLHSTDVAWANKYNKLTADIMGDAEADQKCVRDRDNGEDGNEKGAEAKEDRPDFQRLSQGVVSSEEKTNFGHNDSDWEELLEYEPSRERILSFLDEREKRNHIMRAFEESLGDIHSSLENEVAAILQIASNLFNEHEAVHIESENEIEYYVIENYERRVNLQKELEQSALHAQGLFANLLSRLTQSVS